MEFPEVREKILSILEPYVPKQFNIEVSGTVLNNPDSNIYMGNIKLGTDWSIFFTIDVDYPEHNLWMLFPDNKSDAVALFDYIALNFSGDLKRLRLFLEHWEITENYFRTMSDLFGSL